MDREKVISKLQILRTWCAVNPDYNMGLPVDDCVKAVGWLDDALALLRHEVSAQEPRVMTLEDVKEGEAYWLEMRGIASEYAICKLNDHGDSAFLDFAVQFGGKTLESDRYGKTWRCWTSRPTDEQREAIPWEQ